jgi:hypothetical protein
MPRPLTRAQVLQNRAFLKLLRRTGNVRLACRELGLRYGTMQHRRRVHPGFAAAVGAAIVFAQASFDKLRMSGSSSRAPSPRSRLRASRPSPAEGGGYRTRGGEVVIVRLASGAIQVRRAQAGKLTPAAEQAFLLALAGTCNVALAAAAVGAAANAFARRAKRDPAFAREVRMALAEGRETLHLALLAGLEPWDAADWRCGEPPPIPQMTVDQVFQLMRVHAREARRGGPSTGSG